MKKTFFYKCNECGKEKGKSNSELCKSCSFKKRKYSTKVKQNISLHHKNREIIPTHPTLTKTELIKILQNMDIDLYKDSRTKRTFYAKYPVIYKDILYYSQVYDVPFYAKILSILDSPVCLCGNTAKWDKQKSTFRPTSKCCRYFYNYTSLYHLQLVNGVVQGYILYFNTRLKNSRKGIRNLEWFQNRYPNGEEEYNNHYRNLFNRRNTAMFSKISQELFQKLNCYIPEDIARKYKLQYANSGYGEYRINLNNEDKKIIGKERVTLFVDFKLGNKIIEFDGDYWHDEKEDIKRDLILERKGFSVLRIKESEYKNNKQKEVEKCLKFLNLR